MSRASRDCSLGLEYLKDLILEDLIHVLHDLDLEGTVRDALHNEDLQYEYDVLKYENKVYEVLYIENPTDNIVQAKVLEDEVRGVIRDLRDNVCNVVDIKQRR